jgi:hypothetical protein
MRTKIKAPLPEVALSRILETLGQELIDASDGEIQQAAKALGMNPQMKGSAAFAGLKFPAEWQLSDFFELDVTTKLQAAGRTIAAPRRESNPATQSLRTDTSKTSKDTQVK